MGHEATTWLSAARSLAGLTPEEFARRWSTLPPGRRRNDALRMRLRFDRERFARFCWPERFERPFNAFQRSLLEQPKERWSGRTEPGRDAVAAPRGYAKSTIGSFVEIVHDIVYDLEAFVVVLSNGASLAEDLVEDVKFAFEDAEGALVRLYGPFVVEGTKSDFTVAVRGRSPIRVLAKSFGKQVRGIKHRGRRPSKVVVDDGEHSDRVRSPDQRKKAWDYLNADILKVGDRRTVYQVRGTVLHPDSMLANLLKRPGWTSAKWQAVKSWPERQDLWAQCKAIWCDLTNENAREDALAYYVRHRAELDLGAEVLDEAAEPIFACYEAIWSEGIAAFLREKQNEPVDPSSVLFNLDEVARCRIVGDAIIAADGRRVPISELTFYGRLDPALGKNAGMPGDLGSGAGDYACIAVIGRDKHGYGYLVDVWMRRARPDEQLEAIWTLHERWRFTRFSIETNGFQALMGRDFRRMQRERREKGLVWQLVVDEDTSSTPKDQRIATLQPPLANGWLQFAAHLPGEPLEQVRAFPTGANDDAPDAIEGAWRMSRQARATTQSRIV